jgi:RNA polymerase sigma-70 factor (ECF subfamily)
MHGSDAELIARWQQGDATAFAILVRRWQQPIARFLTHTLGPSAPVADLCQEVFVRVHDAGRRYRESGAFSTWLYRIALNIARDAARRRRQEPLPLEDLEPLADGPGPERVCARRELAGLVARALSELPEALREVLVLRHYEDMNFEQIARLTGTPASTLKSRFAVALERLRQRLLQWGCHPEDLDP